MYTIRKLFFIYLLRFVTCSSYEDEQRLRKHLLPNDSKNNSKTYSKNIRPVKDSNNPTDIRVNLTTLAIHELNLNTGYLVTQSILQLTWKDQILTWEPKDYGNITKINVYSDEVWMPSVFVCNSDQGMNKRGEIIYAFKLSNDGEVTFVEAKTLRTFCDINVHKYPFDEHLCNITLCVEDHDALDTPITDFTHQIVEAKQNHLWDIKSIPKPSLNPTHISASMHFTRKLHIGSVATVLPAAILSILTVWVFVLPPESGEKVSLATTLLLADVVYMVEMGRMLGADSKYPPMLVLYIIALTTCSGLYTIGAIIICKMQVLSKENPDNKRPGNNNAGVADLETTPEESKKIKIKRMTCHEYRRLDNILLYISCVIFGFFAIIFIVYFNINLDAFVKISE